MTTKRQKQIVEHFIKSETRKALREAETPVNDDNSWLNKNIAEFIKRNEGQSDESPKIKLFGSTSESKFVNISFNTLRKFLSVLK